MDDVFYKGLLDGFRMGADPLGMSWSHKTNKVTMGGLGSRGLNADNENYPLPVGDSLEYKLGKHTGMGFGCLFNIATFGILQVGITCLNIKNYYELKEDERETFDKFTKDQLWIHHELRGQDREV